MTTFFENATSANMPFENPKLANPNVALAVSPRKHSLLPLLTVLFLISYGLMTMLIVEQGSTIESQRALIHELLRDSNELAATKGNATREKTSAGRRRSQSQFPSAQDPAIQTPSNQTPSDQTPSNQAPFTQAPLTQAPSFQVAPQHQGETLRGKGQKPKFQLPARPASDLADVRRALRTI